jgi:hypothetical protein
MCTLGRLVYPVRCIGSKMVDWSKYIHIRPDPAGLCTGLNQHTSKPGTSNRMLRSWRLYKGALSLETVIQSALPIVNPI